MADLRTAAGAAPEQSVLVVTGMSGAGRSTVGNALEDLGWYVVDNLPPQMLKPLLDLAGHSGGRLSRVAVVVDVRGGQLLSELRDVASEQDGRPQIRLLFLEANDAALVRRFEAVRRPHPMQEGGTILDGITAERALTLAVREQSDIIIDTSELNIHQLASAINELFADDETPGVRVTITSFGFKYGVPTDADMVADARFLPNPFWVPELRPLTGRDAQVRDYVLGQRGASEFVERYAAAVAPVLEGYQRENKSHATIAVGCTGGKHRSVALVERLAALLAEQPGVVVNVKHRDLGRE
ncbi:RNase adapter RapZ [Amnibacterium sp. CER49]|uniref:RNase adapter RapZ n=1 Tax=Amnibacterium sp. CER49 TaxID=3039161 RepID=UPI00244B442C|nr:RNase adapter RapZ [Amnibacterium sp. CER49]MDH2444408.1 RNase adapter RapZ [Amnibacterium sp. CER49]